jgi:hypothetical protein
VTKKREQPLIRCFPPCDARDSHQGKRKGRKEPFFHKSLIVWSSFLVQGPLTKPGCKT